MEGDPILLNVVDVVEMQQPQVRRSGFGAVAPPRDRFGGTGAFGRHGLELRLRDLRSDRGAGSPFIYYCPSEIFSGSRSHAAGNGKDCVLSMGKLQDPGSLAIKGGQCFFEIFQSDHVVPTSL